MPTKKGSKLTIQHIEAIRRAMKGITPKNIEMIKGWNKGKKMSKAFCDRQSYMAKNGIIGMKGKHHTEETKAKQRKSNKTKMLWENPEYRKMMSESKQRLLVGSNNSAYIDGRTPLVERIRHSKKSQEWIISIFRRDKFTCQHCLKQASGKLEAHHIKKFSTIFSENNIKTFKQAMDCQEFWDINNGITLCVECHLKTR